MSKGTELRQGCLKSNEEPILSRQVGNKHGKGAWGKTVKVHMPY